MLAQKRLALVLGLFMGTACAPSPPPPAAPDASVPDPADPDAAGPGDPTSDAGSRDATVDAVIADSSVDAAADAARDAPRDRADIPDAPPLTPWDGGASPAVVTVGATDRILLVGLVVTPDVAFEGQVLVEGASITCVQPGTACAGELGAAGATVIDTHGIIAPGLIDTHNHILFDIFDGDDWLPTQTYQNHNQWPNEPRYKAMLDVKQCLEDASQGKPTWCPATYDGTGSLKCEMDKWGELKGIVAGTTSIVGLPGTSSACFGSLARSVDAAQNGLGTDKIQTSALFPPSRSSADGVCSNFTGLSTNAYLIHCGEGTDATSLAEWARLGSVSTTSACLYAPQTVITHGTAFTANEFAQMATAGMKLTWSPASNVALYGATTNIPAALDANVTITLAPDWSMGGSQNLLDEMRFASTWDDAHFGDRLSAKDIVRMTTANAATALALADRIGAIRVGQLADLMVVSRADADPFASIVAARPRHVRMTMVGGRILYGDLALKAAAPQAPGCEDIDICGVQKFVCVAEATTTSKLGQTHAEIKAALEAAMLDVDAVTPADGYDFAPLAPLVKCQ